MKRTIVAAMLLFSGAALSDHIDVIEFTLNEGCSKEKYLEIVNDFREQWGSKNGYETEILFPVQSNNMTSLFWVGRSANAAAFGAAYDKWTTELADPDSTAAGLGARFAQCSTSLGRRGYLTE
jgi:hypothetical protein